MEFHANCRLIATFLALISCSSFAQQNVRTKQESFPSSQALRDISPDDQQMTADDGLAIIAAAFDFRIRLTAKRDCSHLVHAIYARAGFPYTYLRSSDLYRGADEFQRVTDPQPGDLVVWRGHVGIVVYLAQHIFFSAMRSGLGIDSYETPYWKRRGKVRFFRYLKANGPTSPEPRFVPAHHDED